MLDARGLFMRAFGAFLYIVDNSQVLGLLMLTLRPATSQDTPGILRLVTEVYAEYDCILDVENDEPYLLDAANYFRSGGGEFWVVEGEGTIKATVAVLLFDNVAELKTLYVHPSLRQQGWGRQLVSRAIEHAHRAGKAKMVLWSDTRFVDAHRLYQKMGFTECSRRELKDVNKSVEYGFEKQLAQ